MFNERFDPELEHFACVIEDDNGIVDSDSTVVVSFVTKRLAMDDFVANSAAVTIETLDTEELAYDIGDDGPEGDDPIGVPGTITISGRDSIEDLMDSSSIRIWQEDVIMSSAIEAK